uniref:Histidine--tRNA ligase n=1 Tax=viral metagenome TaxID=1070528 RepID=A0A6C0CCG5_9ZZZZ
MKITINLDPPAGTRDFFPEDMWIRNWMLDIWRNISKQFGFSEYDAPVVEYADLYTRTCVGCT